MKTQAHIGWEACRRQVFSLTEHTAEALSESTSDFERGRQFEAKSIAKAMNSFGPEDCDELRAAHASPALRIDFKQATEQGGWQLVPKEPTPAMVDAFHCEDGDSARNKWRAMLAAAPKQPSPQSEEGSLFLGVADGDAVGGKSGGDA